MTERKQHLDGLAVSLLLASCLFWGFQQILIKTTVGEVPPLWQAALRFTGATALLGLWCARGLSSIEWRVLATLHDGEPLHVSQLAQEVLSKQPTVTKLVQRMAEQGWVSLQADPADQRRTLVSATAAGRRLVRPLVEQAKAHEARLLRALGATEKKALRQLLEKLVAAQPERL